MATAGYSTNVVLRLVIEGRTLALSHVGPSGLVVRDDCPPIPAGHGELRIEVDGATDRQDIYLPDGIPGGRTPVPYF